MTAASSILRLSCKHRAAVKAANAKRAERQRKQRDAEFIREFMPRIKGSRLQVPGGSLTLLHRFKHGTLSKEDIEQVLRELEAKKAAQEAVAAARAAAGYPVGSVTFINCEAHKTRIVFRPWGFL